MTATPDSTGGRTLPATVRPFFGPSIPHPSAVWRPLRVWIWIAFAYLALRALPSLIVDSWFFESVSRSQVFWTNLNAQAILFVIGGALFALVTIVPVRRYAVNAELRRAAVHTGLWVAMFAGWALSTRYAEFLLAVNGGRFNEVDPVFGHDVGFFVFKLPALQTSIVTLLMLATTGGVAAIVGRFDEMRNRRAFLESNTSLTVRLAQISTSALTGFVLLAGLSLAALTFLERYALVFADNEASGVRTGADYLDVTGVFSTLRFIEVSVVVEVGLTLVICYALYRALRSPAAPAQRLFKPRSIALVLVTLDLSFYAAVAARNHLSVAPNEPTIQVPFIQRHIDATLRAYRLRDVRTVPWSLPTKPRTVDEILASSTVQNAPVLPSWVSNLEQPTDRQHFVRLNDGAPSLVYGPMLQVFQQEQQLRPYYDFVSVDGTRYTVNGAKRMYVSAVRELPSVAFQGEKAWLRYWGSGALMYTHGLGLVMSPANEVNPDGGPYYEARDVPPRADHPMFDIEPRVYVGEALKDNYVLTGIRGLKEFDYATRQSRSEYVYPAEAADGIRLSSAFRRLVFAAYTHDVTAFLFSRFIDHGRTRVHIYRTPMRRAGRIAPFLFLDSNPYAFAADGRMLWMVNGLTVSSNFPYSFREVLGDKADERAIEEFPQRVINYAEDAVKVTIDAFTGQTRFYQITDDPIVSAWARVYPGLFEPRSAMPSAVESQLTYPLQWFHIQFDDIYKRYHQRNPIEFYNVEDLWDDADEVLGSIGRGLTEFGTTDQATFSYEGHSVLIDPADLPSGANAGTPGQLQFALMMPFTPEAARNLRSVIVVLQDPGHYGTLLSLRIAQGEFVPGPEQIDAAIDTDAQVNQQITLWVRHGAEVVRGHTLLLPVGGDLLFVEPLWIISLQNKLPQLKAFSVVYRGRTTTATTLSDAIRLLGVPESEEQAANALPWIREARSGAPVTRRPRQ